MFKHNDENRISHGLRWYTIFIQRIVCFLTPSQGSGLENIHVYNLLDKNREFSFWRTFFIMIRNQHYRRCKIWMLWYIIQICNFKQEDQSQLHFVSKKINSDFYLFNICDITFFPRHVFFPRIRAYNGI